MIFNHDASKDQVLNKITQSSITIAAFIVVFLAFSIIIATLPIKKPPFVIDDVVLHVETSAGVSSINELIKITSTEAISIRLERELQLQGSNLIMNLPAITITANGSSETIDHIYNFPFKRAGVWCAASTYYWTPSFSLREHSFKRIGPCIKIEATL